jgi:hypothetical protein
LHSDALKQARADEDTARRAARPTQSRHGTVTASAPDSPQYAWLIHGSREQATYLRKHGHGVPWRYKYKVLEVKPHAARLEIPNDGSVPRVKEWQLLRRLTPAHPGEHGPTADSPVITDSGLAIPLSPATVSPAASDPLADGSETAYDIECVSHAERVGNLYKIWLKWRGYSELTFRWRHELVRETTNLELLSEIETAVTQERDRLRAQQRAYAEDEVEDWTAPPPPEATPDDTPSGFADAPGPISGRLRSRAATVLLVSECDSDFDSEDAVRIAFDYHTSLRGSMFYMDVTHY